MGVSKLKAIHVIIIGSLACLIVIVGLYFLMIKKSCEKIKSLRADYQKYEETWNQKSTAEANLAAVKLQSQQIKNKYEKYSREKMPPVSFEKKEEGMIALWKEQVETLGPLLYNWPRKTGVIFNSGVQVPAPGVNPNDIYNPAVNSYFIPLELNEFTVTGSFHTILSHIRSWNKFNRLVKIDLESLTGQSPGMTAKYKVTVYILPRGEEGPAVTMAGTGTGQAAQGAVGGMMSGPPSPIPQGSPMQGQGGT